MRTPQWVPVFAIEYFTAKRGAFDPCIFDRIASAASAECFLTVPALSERDPLLLDWLELFLCMKLIQGEEYASTWRRLGSIADGNKFAAFMRQASVHLAYVLLFHSADHRRDTRSRFVLKISGASALILGGDERGIVCDLTIAAFGRTLDRKRVRAVCRSAWPDPNAIPYGDDVL